MEGLTQVNAAIKELLHIDDKQFKQIAMIAQGEFWDLLNAKTDKRTEILRTIFLTDGYKSIEYKLKDRMDESYRERKNAENSILTYFKGVEAEASGEVYEDLKAAKAREEASKSAWNLDELLEIVKRALNQDEAMLEQEKERLDKETETLEQIKADRNLAMVNNKLLAKVKELEEKKLDLEQKKPEIDEIREVLELQKRASRIVNPAYRNWQAKEKEKQDTQRSIIKNEDELTELNRKKSHADNVLAEAEKKRPEAEAFKKTADKIEDEKNDYVRRDKLTKDLTKLQNNQVLFQGQEQELLQEKKQLEEKINTLKELVRELNDKPEELHIIRTQMEQWNEWNDNIAALLGGAVLQRSNLQADLVNKQKIYTEKSEEFENAKKMRERIERQLENSRAGILAQTLKEGEKCPVCGSVHHPEPALLPEDAADEASFNDSRKKEDSKREVKEKALLDAETCKKALQENEFYLKQNVANCLKKAFSDQEIPEDDLDAMIPMLKDAGAQIRAKLEDSNGRKKQLENECQKLENARTDLENAQEKETSALSEKQETLRKKTEENNHELIEARAEIKTLENLSYADWETAEAELIKAKKAAKEILTAIDVAVEEQKKAASAVTGKESAIKTLQEELEKQKVQIEQLSGEFQRILHEQGFHSTEEMMGQVVSESDLEKAESNIREFEQEVKANGALLEQAKEEAEGKTYMDVEELENALQEQDSLVKAVTGRVNTIDFRHRSNVEKRNGMNSLKESYEEAEKVNNVCTRLYNLVKGQTGNGKITLEQYIQAAGFDGIIMAANRRLLPMSDNQYELYRQEDSPGKKSNTFLDLEVLDNYTGRRRPVGNLSGGESFKASLSLALGLSDTVSSNLGGIQMDALFVDEGFGTLDRKSIENALDILIHLSSTSKLVGVISHREELIENIPQQIKVTKDKEGSRLVIETGM